MKFLGLVLDVQPTKEVHQTKDLAYQLKHVMEQANMLVFGIPNTAVLVEHAHQGLDMSSELIEAAVIESDKPVIVSQDSTKTHGNVLDALMAKEDLPTKELVKLLIHVLETSNISVSTILKAAVFAEPAHKELDGL